MKESIISTVCNNCTGEKKETGIRENGYPAFTVFRVLVERSFYLS